MSKIDLCIENYSLEDILKLFKLNYDFTKSELKQAQKIVYKTHPDKSELPKEYFLFYIKAFKIIKEIYDFRHQKTKSTDYHLEDNKEHEELLKNIKNKKNFNKWFNQMFEQVKLYDNESESGYGDWLTSSEGLDEIILKNKNDMGEMFEKKKRDVQNSIIKHDTFQEIQNSSNQYNLLRESKQSYEADIFSKLQFDDLKKAHTESVVPVTQRDFENTRKFNDVEQLIGFRSSQNANIPSLEESNNILRQKESQEQKFSSRIAFDLIKQDERIQKANSKWWSNIKRITN